LVLYQKMKLNLGSGDILLPEFNNLDLKDGFDMGNGLPDFPNESVDGITISHAVSQVDSKYYPLLFSELYRVLKKGGVVRIADDNHNQTPERIKELNFDNPTVLGKTSPTVTRACLEDAGFMVFDVNFDETYYSDKSLIQVNYNRVDKDIYFHIEGIK
jgi:ubiquinone/menaquinone biosynthesis C-methylase UbiE